LPPTESDGVKDKEPVAAVEVVNGIGPLANVAPTVEVELVVL
jgi:hypothetical protein